jgi:hypothetical protein
VPRSISGEFDCRRKLPPAAFTNNGSSVKCGALPQ